ncbi:MAG: YozQ family protein [Ectobacillus sp.]
MPKKQASNATEQSGKLADKMYHAEDYNKQDQLSQAFSITHEQVSDCYAEGTIDGAMENVAGKDIPLEGKGYEQ